MQLLQALHQTRETSDKFKLCPLRPSCVFYFLLKYSAPKAYFSLWRNHQNWFQFTTLTHSTAASQTLLVAVTAGDCEGGACVTNALKNVQQSGFVQVSPICFGARAYTVP